MTARARKLSAWAPLPRTRVHPVVVGVPDWGREARTMLIPWWKPASMRPRRLGLLGELAGRTPRRGSRRCRAILYSPPHGRIVKFRDMRRITVARIDLP